MRGRYWFSLAGVVLILALILKLAPLVLIALLFLLSGGVSRLWNRFCLHRVEFRRGLSHNKVFFGEEIFYETDVANRKLLPLPWLRIEDELPEEVTLLKGNTTATIHRRALLSHTFPIGWYHKIKRRYPIQCRQRGMFAFGPARIRSGDLFGLFHREMVEEKRDILTVFPRLVPLDALGISSKQLFGDIRTQNHLFQDPVLTAGVRDYRSGDSLKRIHWKSSARLGKLQTRVYEKTTTVDITIFLDVRTVEVPLRGSIVQLQELGIITAAAIAKHALQAGFRVGLYANHLKAFSEGAVQVPPSRHVDQLLHILEALAQLRDSETMPISRYIWEEAPRLAWGTTLLAVAAQPNEELLSTLVGLKRPGRNIALVKVGGELVTVPPEKLNVYHVSDDVAWEMIDAISIHSGMSNDRQE